MTTAIILASGSRIRAELLRNAGLKVDVQAPRLDEATIRQKLLSRNLPAGDIAEALAERKARRISQKNPDSHVIGCDQVLEFNDIILSKPTSREDALTQLKLMRGHSHRLLSAAVICRAGQVIWQHVGVVRLTMRNSSDAYLKGYVARNWDSIRQAVGAYKLEEEGVRLFSHIDGDYFHVLGMPLLELLNDLTQRGVLET